VTFDFGLTSKLTLTAHFPTVETAKKAEPVAKTALKAALDALAEARKATDADTAEKDWLPVYDYALAGLKSAKITQDGKVLTAMMSPVRKSFVPDEIVNQAIQKYGANLYAIGSSKGSDGQDMYHVTLIENGQSRTEWMNADGSTADNHFRKADEPTMQQESMSVQQENQIVNQDSTVNQPMATDSMAKDQPQRTEAEPEQHSHPQNQDREEGNSDWNNEGINNASEINASPKRL